MARAWPHRSMFGQMALLTLMLVGIGIYVIAIRPILDVLPPSAFDPLDISAQKVTETINTEIFALDGHPDRPASHEFGAVMAAAARHNPNFRYYVRVGDRTFGNMPAPVYFANTGLARLEAVRRQMPALDLCMQMFRHISRTGSKGSMEYIYCNSPRYYEFFGLEPPFPTDIDRTDRAFSKIFWSYSDRFIYSVIAVFAVVSIVILFNIWTIRRVARVAQSFDGTQLDLQLPEKGIPQEVLPLVRAVNNLIGRLATTQTRQKFFLSAAAHEMRTPLTVLRTRLELLDESPVKDKLIGDVRRLTTLVNQLLTLMKINTLVEVEGAFDLVASARKVIAGLGPLATPRGIAITFAPQRDGFAVAGSAELIEVAIANLIDNALSFTPDGGEVFVALDADGQLSVRDFGPGIDPAKASSLFEPFVRHPSNRRGHGLGLAIVKAVVTLHGGTVDARNADGAGAVFELRLPQDADPNREKAANATPVRIPSFSANP